MKTNIAPKLKVELFASLICLSTLTEINQSYVVPKIARSAYILRYAIWFVQTFQRQQHLWSRLIHRAILGKMHPPSASFLGGLRMYKIVLLGEGGVGKSGQFNNVRARKTLHRLVARPKEFTSKHPANNHTRKRFWSFNRNHFLDEFPYSSEVSVIIWIAYGLVYEEFPWEI